MWIRRWCALVAATLATDREAAAQTARPPGELEIVEVMIDPSAVPDTRGEWFRLRNNTRRPIDIRGYRFISARDRQHVVARAVVIPPAGVLTVAREIRSHLNGGIAADYGYGDVIAFANGGDWLVVKNAAGITLDSAAWSFARPGVSWKRVAAAAADGTDPHELLVRVLDVGQGDAILVTNGGSRVLVDGGPDPRRLGVLLDSLGLNGGTIDVVVLSHAHADHYNGLRELFRSERRIAVRYFFESGDAVAGEGLAELRDSVASRVSRGALAFRDADDPCGDGRSLCTITLRGGARLHVMRPKPSARDANNRSIPLKLVGPDSASFSMWLAGDAEHEALAWYDVGANYDVRPGMRVPVVKANHHGSCNGLSAAFLRQTAPEVVIMSVGATNDYGHVHEQTKAVYGRAGLPWYRTDRNGTITLHSPGLPDRGYSVYVARGPVSSHGRSDRASRQAACNPMP